jgi:hypothetical protein
MSDPDAECLVQRVLAGNHRDAGRSSVVVEGQVLTAGDGVGRGADVDDLDRATANTRSGA